MDDSFVSIRKIFTNTVMENDYLPHIKIITTPSLNEIDNGTYIDCVLSKKKSILLL